MGIVAILFPCIRPSRPAKGSRPSQIEAEKTDHLTKKTSHCTSVEHVESTTTQSASQTVPAEGNHQQPSVESSTIPAPTESTTIEYNISDKSQIRATSTSRPTSSSPQQTPPKQENGDAAATPAQAADVAVASDSQHHRHQSSSNTNPRTDDPVDTPKQRENPQESTIEEPTSCETEEDRPDQTPSTAAVAAALEPTSDDATQQGTSTSSQPPARKASTRKLIRMFSKRLSTRAPASSSSASSPKPPTSPKSVGSPTIQEEDRDEKKFEAALEVRLQGRKWQEGDNDSLYCY